MGNILGRIASTKRREVEAMKRVIPIEEMRLMALGVGRKVIPMSRSIRDHSVAIIAEHKRRSPSKGEIAPMSDVEKVAAGYASAGAAAMSVLTDTSYFGGSLTDLAVARDAARSLPLLRKEFIVDAYQIYQARVYGADAILLIAAMLNRHYLFQLNDIAHTLGLETLVELHSLDELERLPGDADMVGVNNRDLTSFTTDISNSSRLVDSLPSGMVKIAESGIRTPEDVGRLKDEGFDGFLIGEAFMKTPDPAERLKEFISRNA